MKKLNRQTGKKGQGLVEYILVVFLIAILCVSIVHKLGTTTQRGFTKAESTLSNEW